MWSLPPLDEADDLLCCSRPALPSFFHWVFHLLVLIPLSISSCTTGCPQNDPLMQWFHLPTEVIVLELGLWRTARCCPFC
jgi:hypothetical protein